jgi:hypothetical protein
MKRRILLTVLMSLLMMVVSYGETPKELKLPNKAVKYENGAITYKGKPYTGKLVTSLVDKAIGYKGFVTLKEGHIEGQIKITSEKNEQELEANVKDGKFDGQYAVKALEGEITLTLEAGILKAQKINYIDGYKEDLTFDTGGLANGTMEMGAQKFSFKDGKALNVGEKNSFVTLKYMKETNSVVIEDIQNGKVFGKKETSLELNVKTQERQIFPALLKD